MHSPRQVLYKQIGDVKLTLDIYNPPGHRQTDKRSCIVFFFGGGWVNGTQTHFAMQSAHLASRGMVAICADYRVQSRHGVDPGQCVGDAKSAMRWVRGHASELGIDPDRIAAGGGSAGGHLAAAAALIQDFDDPQDDLAISSRPQALVLFNPVIDNGPDGYAPDSIKTYWQAFSPMHNIAKGVPPAIFFLGTKDQLIPVATADAFKRKIEAVGGTCDVVLYPDQSHGFFNQGALYDHTLCLVDQFLVKHGLLQELASGLT